MPTGRETYPKLTMLVDAKSFTDHTGIFLQGFKMDELDVCS